MDEETFRAALDAHRARHPNPWEPAAQAELQQLHLTRADLLEALPDAAVAAEALAHLRAAEDIQWAMGSESTSAGEGMASMSRLYEIRARRARMCERIGERDEALSLWEGIAADPNGLGMFAVPEVARLQAGR
jgi:hypothetical protein